jgi:hypothetical protein
MILPYMRGPRFFNSDLSMQKTFNVSEQQSFELRMEAFNFLNHPMWSFDPAQTSKLELQMQEDQAGNRTFLSSDKWGMATTKYGHRIVERYDKEPHNEDIDGLLRSQCHEQHHHGNSARKWDAKSRGPLHRCEAP